MPLTKRFNFKHIIYILLFVVLFFATRLPRLDSDEINPDAVNWHYRAEQFVVGLKSGELMKTYQHYHPAVTLMWIIGVTVEAAKRIYQIPIYNQYSFYTFQFVSKYALIVFQLELSVFIIYLLTKIVGFNRAFFTVFLLSIEPFFLGNSRLLHMDILFTLFVFISLILSYLFIIEEKWYFGLLTGVFIGLSFLTKSIGLGVYVFVLFFGSFFLHFRRHNAKLIYKYIVLVTVPFVFSTFLLFPALWVNARFVLVDIFSEGVRVGIRNGHNQIFFGKYTENPRAFFYPIILLMKTSPTLLIGIVLYLITLFKIYKARALKKEIIIFNKEKLVGFITLSGIFYLGYFLVMSITSKKLDRYMLVLFPYLSLVAVYGYSYFLTHFYSKKYINEVYVAVVYLMFSVIPLFTYFPYYFLYTSPLFGSTASANKIVAQKSFGIGIYDVKTHLESNYGSNVKVGFYDTKPLKAIYKNSLVYDIRVASINDYNVIVLGINEELPDKVLKSDVKFIHKSSIYFSGLEYWRFYVKQAK